MKFRYPFAIFGLAVLIILIACNNSGNLVGLALYQSKSNSVPSHCMLHAAPSDTFYQTTISTGNSVYLFVGESNQISCKSLILFDQLPDSGVLDSASVTLQLLRVIGISSAAFNLNIHLLESEWEESDTQWDAFSIDNLGEPDSTVILSMPEVSDDTVNVTFRFQIPLSWIKNWQDTLSAAPNRGMAFTSDAGFIAEFGSRESSYRPLLSLYAHIENDTTKIENHLYPMQDVFIPNTDVKADSDYLLVSNGVGFRSLLYFDVSSIPPTATINHALIRFSQDSTLNFPYWKPGLTFPLTGGAVTDMPWLLPEIPYDSTYSAYGLAYGDSASINITSLVQRWTTGEMENHGTMVMGTNEKNDLFGAAFYSTTADFQNRPVLEIFYSLPTSVDAQ